jgi:hypothetical protein
MKAITLNLAPGRRELRQFGLIALGAFGALGAMIYWRGGLFGWEFGSAGVSVAFALWGIGGLSGLFSLVAPALNRPLYLALSVISYPIGLVLSYVIMAALFYGILMPVGLAFALTGRDSLLRRFEPQTKSYWVRPKLRESRESYFNQF